mmetsp:Transcript_24945/g.70233  ORF Transcript_24945/g.70233 Transcript_24945/m.70233 type:complete len:322 (-) Transcript_24945:278-1243(-)
MHELLLDAVRLLLELRLAPLELLGAGGHGLVGADLLAVALERLLQAREVEAVLGDLLLLLLRLGVVARPVADHFAGVLLHAALDPAEALVVLVEVPVHLALLGYEGLDLLARAVLVVQHLLELLHPRLVHLDVAGVPRHGAVGFVHHLLELAHGVVEALVARGVLLLLVLEELAVLQEVPVRAVAVDVGLLQALLRAGVPVRQVVVQVPELGEIPPLAHEGLLRLRQARLHRLQVPVELLVHLLRGLHRGVQAVHLVVGVEEAGLGRFVVLGQLGPLLVRLFDLSLELVQPRGRLTAARLRSQQLPVVLVQIVPDSVALRV